ncbi:hypothetical protein B0H14DRAFT_3470793 [Mycena olivaceomarginata]|nr:hypothetical protein B0H14DRAFT_3470793 [Mycena olivaceomarginata]
MDFSPSQTSISTEDIGLCSRSPDDATEQIQQTAEEAMDVVEAAHARFTSLESLPSSPRGPRTSRATPSASSASGSLLLPVHAPRTRPNVLIGSGAPPRCAACKGKHPSYSKDCPVRAQERDLQHHRLHSRIFFGDFDPLDPSLSLDLDAPFFFQSTSTITPSSSSHSPSK